MLTSYMTASDWQKDWNRAWLPGCLAGNLGGIACNPTNPSSKIVASSSSSWQQPCIRASLIIHPSSRLSSASYCHKDQTSKDTKRASFPVNPGRGSLSDSLIRYKIRLIDVKAPWMSDWRCWSDLQIYCQWCCKWRWYVHVSNSYRRWPQRNIPSLAN